MTTTDRPMTDTTHHARLTVDDLSQVAMSWRLKAMRGDKTTCAIAGALESVVRQRRASEMARERARASRFKWAPLRKAANWAISLY